MFEAFNIYLFQKDKVIGIVSSCDVEQIRDSTKNNIMKVFCQTMSINLNSLSEKHRNLFSITNENMSYDIYDFSFGLHIVKNKIEYGEEGYIKTISDDIETVFVDDGFKFSVPFSLVASYKDDLFMLDNVKFHKTASIKTLKIF